MTMILRNKSSANHPQNKKSPSKRLEFSDISDEDKKLFLISNCRLFDPIYLGSCNVVAPLFSKDIDSSFENPSLEIHCHLWPSKKNTPQSPSTSLLIFVEAIWFFNGFEGEKIRSWLKLFGFFEIIQTNLQTNEGNFLENFVKHFELGEESLSIDFSFLQHFKESAHLNFTCNFLQFFSNFCLKKIVTRNFCPENDLFKVFYLFIAGNSSSLVHLEFDENDFSKCYQFENGLFFANLENITINSCSEFDRLAIQFGTKLISFKSTSQWLYIKEEDEIHSFVYRFSGGYSSAYNQCSRNFVKFLQNNPQIEDLIYTNSFAFIVDEEIEKAIFSLNNLKKLDISIASPMENYLGSKKIERFIVRGPTIGTERNWNYLAEFPLLNYLEIDFCPFIKNDLLNYIQLDRLEYLLIRGCRFEKEEEKEFFKCIYNFKRLKALAVTIQWTNGIVLGDSIESASLNFKGKTFSFTRDRKYSQHLIEKLSSQLPKGANVKYLQFFTEFKEFDVQYPGNLKDNFPKLEKLRNHTRFCFKPKGFSIIQDSKEFTPFMDF